MGRRTNTIRVQQGWGGEDDSTPATVAPNAASRMENVYRWRNVLKRRAGQTALAASLGAATVRLLDWCRIDGTAHLIEVHDGDVRDWLAASVGAIVGNGTDRLPASGSTDCNAALVEGHLVIGNGTDANVRYNGGDAGLAADMTVVTTQGLRVAYAANALFQNPDLTVLATFYLDSIALNATDTGIVGRQVVASIWDRSTASGRSWRLAHNPNTNRFLFQVRGTTGTETEIECTSVTPAVGQWYTAVGRHDDVGNTISIQVNGGTVHSTAHTDGLNLPSNVDLHVGSQFNGSGVASGVLDGRIGPVGVWRSAGSGGGHLTDALALSLYRTLPRREADLSAAQEAALIAFWDMEETSGTRDDDHSAATTYNLLEFGGTTSSAAGPYAALAVARQMVEPCTSTPTLVTSTSGSDTHPADTFEYRFSFLNADGEPGEAGPILERTVALDFDSSVQSIPAVPSGQDSSGVRIWRRHSASTVFQKVIDITDGSTTYIDVVLNADLGEELIEENVATPPLKYMAEHNGRLVGANGTDNELVISNKFEHYYSPEAPDVEDVLQGGRDRLQGKGGGVITGVATHGAFCAVFTGSAGHFLTGDAPLDFAVNRFSNHGCVAHRTIKSTRNWLIWLAADGVYAWVDGVTKLISEQQRATVEAITAADMAAAHAYVWDDKYFLCWPSGCIYFDLEYQHWGTYTNWTWQDTAVSEFSGGAKEKVYGAALAIARVFQLETGATDNGTTITALWASADWDMGMAGRNKRVHYLEARFKKGTGTATITLKKGTGYTVQTETWDISTVDDSSETVSRFFKSCKEEAVSEFFRMEVSVPTTAAELEVEAVGAHWMAAS